MHGEFSNAFFEPSMYITSTSPKIFIGPFASKFFWLRKEVHSYLGLEELLKIVETLKERER